MKEICIVTNYFPPETGAASNRISFLATLLAKKGYKVTVLCPLPNYPKGQILKGYRRSFFRKEAQANISTTFNSPNGEVNAVLIILPIAAAPPKPNRSA